MTKFVLKVVLTVITFGCCMPDLPPQIKVCPGRNNIAGCVRDSIERLKPALKSGLLAPGIKVESFDPMNLGNIFINPGFELKLFGLQIAGMSNFKIEKLRLGFEKFKLEAILLMPKASLKANYALNWKVALLNLQGKGEAFGVLENTRSKLKITGTKYLKQGIEYLKIDDVAISSKPASIKVRFENLFNGQKGLEDVANEVINQNVQLIEQSVLPEVERILSSKILNACNDVFSRAPMIDFFPN